jgi:hypothetical protein
MFKRFTLGVCTVAIASLMTAAAAAEEITHSFLACGGKTYIREMKPGDKPDKTGGKIVWEYPNNTRDGYVLPSGNVLLAVSRGGAYPGGGAIEITRDNKVLWEYKGTQEEVNSVQKTAEGTYVLTEAGPKPRLLEIAADGKVVVEFPLQCQNGNGHMETRMTRKQPDGTYLCPHLLDFAVKHYDKTGKVLQVIDTTIDGDTKHDTHSWPFTAIRLANGNTLCGLTHSNRLAEFDKDGKKVWEVTNDDVGGIIKDACGVQRLPNGNTVVTSYASNDGEVNLWEITPDKKIVWTFKGDGHIHNFQVLDTNGVPLPGPPMK